MMRNESELLIALEKARQDFAAIQALLGHQKAAAANLQALSAKPYYAAIDQNPDIEIQVSAKLSALNHQLELADQLVRQNNECSDATSKSLQNENRYKQIVEDQIDLICRYQADFTLTFVNEAYAAMYQKRPEELIGTNFFDLMSPEDCENSLVYLSKLSPDNPVASSEHRSLLPDGTVRWLQWTDRVIMDANQQIIEFQGVGRDITDRVVAEQAAQEQRRYADALQESLVVLTSSLDVDTVMEHILEYAAHVVPCDAANIMKYDNGIGSVAYTRGYSTEAQVYFKEGRYAIQNSPYVRAGKSYLITDTQTEQDWIHIPTTEWIRSCIGVPIVMQDEVMGLLSVDSALPNRYTHSDLEHLEVFARYAALALKNAYEASRLEEKVAEQTANLTQAKNRVEAILNNSMDGILLAYIDTGISQTNTTFNTLFRSREADYQNKPLTSLVCAEHQDLVTATLQSVFSGQQGKTIEVRSCRPDGATFDAELGIGFLGAEDQGKVGFVCTIRDISARKIQERELRYYASLQASVSDAVIVSDIDLNILTWNKAAEQIYGWQAEEIIGKSRHEVLQPEFPDVQSKNLAETLVRDGFWSGELKHHRKDGTEIHVLVNATLLKDENGIPFGIVSVNHDITERKHAEIELAEERNRLRTLIDSVPDHIYVKDLQHRFVLSNQSLALNYQFQSPEEMIGKTDFDLFPAAIAQGFKEEEAKILAGGDPEISRVLQVYGFKNKRAWYSITKVPLRNLQGEIVGLVGIAHDVSEQRKVEQAIEENAREIYDLYNHAPCGYHSLNSEGVFVQINEMELNWIGYTYEEVIGKLKFTDILTDKGKEYFAVNFPLFKQRGWIKDAEFDIVCKDGSYKTVLLNAVVVRDENNDYLMSRTTLHDITQLKQTEHALRESEEKFRLIIESAPVPIVISDHTGQITLINKQSEILFGYRQDELIGQSIEILLPEDMRHKHVGKRNAYHMSAPAHTIHVGRDFIARRKDGSTCPVEIDLSNIETPGGKLVISFIVDISDRKERERQLRFNASLQNNVTDAVIATDMNFSIQSWNGAAERIYGWHTDEAIGQNSGKLFKTRFAPGENLESFQQALFTNGKWQSEVVQVRKDGSEVHILSSISIFKDEQDNPLGVVGVNHDITERKERERQLRFNASLQENVTEAVIATDLKYNIQTWNRAAESIYGWTADEVVGKSVSILKTQFKSGESLERIEREFRENGYWTDEVIQHGKHGVPIDILSSVVLFRDENGDPLGVVSVNHDITARKQADEALQLKIESELEFQIYLKALHDITIELTQIDRVDDFYKHVVELGLERLGFERLALFLYDKETGEAVGTYGTSPEGSLTNEHDLHWTPDPDGAMMRAFQRDERFCFDEDITLYQELVPIGKGWNASAALWDGTKSIGWLVADNFIHRQPASKALLDTLALYAMTVGTLLARKQTDAALRESETRYRLLAENISDVIIRLNPVGEILYASPSSLAMLGYHPEEMLGRAGLEFVNSEDVAEIISRINHATDGTAPTTSIVFRFYHKQRHMIWLEATGQLITSSATGEVIEFIASLRDISERKRAEEAIKQALEKEKELGELKSRFVSMTSHEFRTPLANIMATTETLSTYRQKMTDQQIEQRFSNIRGQVDHLKDIIDDVLQFTRIDLQFVEYNPQPSSLDALCQEIVGEFDSRADVPHQLIYTAENMPLTMDFDKKLMRQIINNLISNAIKYSPSDKPVKVSLVCKDSVCIVTVADQGIGIPEADLKHMYEPFHRATNVGTISGTGLGLIITRKAVELHGGTIAIHSKVGIGTTITLEIPVVTQKENPRD